MKLEDYREKQHLSYDNLASIIGLSKNMTWRICKGKAPCITLYHANMIVLATKGIVTFDALISDLGIC